MNNVLLGTGKKRIGLGNEWAKTIFHSEGVYNHTAFLGKDTNSLKADEDRLFLITYDGIVDAANPRSTWQPRSLIHFDISRWVDVEMKVTAEK